MLEITELNRLLKYDPETGVLTWRVARGPRAAGSVAGCACKDDYVRIRLNWRLELGHRVAWAMVHGEWPSQHVDHINNDPSDNRIANLRLATKQQNAANSKHQARNKAGFKGVWLDKDIKGKNRWTATIRVNGRNTYLGHFATPEAAHQAYLDGARKHFGEFARGA